MASMGKVARAFAIAVIAHTCQLGSAAAQARARPAGAQVATIDLDLQRADVRDVLRLLAEVGGVNLIYGDEVAGEVTLRLNGVPWQQALAAVLAVKGLAMQRQDDVILVGTEQSFARYRQARIDARTQCLRTAPLRSQIVRVNYAKAQDLLPHIRAGLSERGSVSYDARTNTLIVRDVDCD